MSVTNEKALIAALKAGLTGVQVVWGFLEQEEATAPPSLPVVCVTRVNAGLLAGGGLKDMCDEDDETSTTIIQVDAWEKDYEAARELNESAHAIVSALVDSWAWQSEVDVRDPQLKAWRISSTWTIDGDR